MAATSTHQLEHPNLGSAAQQHADPQGIQLRTLVWAISDVVLAGQRVQAAIDVAPVASEYVPRSQPEHEPAPASEKVPGPPALHNIAEGAAAVPQVVQWVRRRPRDSPHKPAHMACNQGMSARRPCQKCPATGWTNLTVSPFHSHMRQNVM